MRREASEPGKFVREFGPRLRVPVRRVQRGDENAVYRCFEIPALRIRGISRQSGSRDNGVAIPREDCDAVPRLLTQPNGAIACVLDRRFRQLRVGGLQLLKADNIGRACAQPLKKVGETLVDVVDVERRDLHPGRGGRIAPEDERSPHETASLYRCPRGMSAFARSVMVPRGVGAEKAVIPASRYGSSTPSSKAATAMPTIAGTARS